VENQTKSYRITFSSWNKLEVIVRLSPMVPNHPDERPSLRWKSSINLLMKASYPSSMGASQPSPMKVSYPSPINPLLRVTHPSLINTHLF